MSSNNDARRLPPRLRIARPKLRLARPKAGTARPKLGTARPKLSAVLMPALVIAAGLVAGCGGPAEPPAPVSSPTVAAVDGAVPFHVDLGAGQHLTVSSPPPGSCPALDVRVDLGHNASVRLTAYAASCTAGGNGAPNNGAPNNNGPNNNGPNNDGPGNGRHGVFRTTADIPVARTVTTAQTALGPATMFTQPYYECTNSCKYYTEPVAVITLAHPSDPDVPALTVYSERGTIDLAGLTNFVRDRLAH